MKQHKSKNIRVLAIAPSRRGFAFAVMEGQDRLVDWAVKSIKKDKNSEGLSKIKKLLSHYSPSVVVLEDCKAHGSRRAPRSQKLNEAILTLSSDRNIRTVLFSRKEILQIFFGDERGTKHAIAKAISVRFPEELGRLMPGKRRAWMSENYRMGIFDAVALALTLYIQNHSHRPNSGIE